jgi:hypothetical protein
MLVVPLKAERPLEAELLLEEQPAVAPNSSRSVEVI